jgi:hypothetical protein
MHNIRFKGYKKFLWQLWQKVHTRFREGLRLRGREHLQDLGISGRIILKWKLNISMGIRRMH